MLNTCCFVLGERFGVCFGVFWENVRWMIARCMVVSVCLAGENLVGIS